MLIRVMFEEEGDGTDLSPEVSTWHWLRPTAALTNPLPAGAYTRPAVAPCCIGCPHIDPLVPPTA